ncbi:MAG TPA: hypothetical protein VM364_06270 [Vicinamibacterales bacterium]|nr:hypothetical protein [Vicinamibacterales bacterium]
MTNRFVSAAALAALLISVPAAAQQEAAPLTGKRWTADVRGFNIVLLVGDMQGTSAAVDDLPQGARRALNDMKEFLPYKNYRVVDSQWTSCCTDSPTIHLSGRLQGLTGDPSGSDTNLVQRPYMFSAYVSGRNDRLQVNFSLHEESSVLVSKGAGTVDTTGRGRSVINSSFAMEIGETVVVGTSRLGGGKALIALITAARKTTGSRD